MLDASKNPAMLNKAIRICKLPEKFRTAEEVHVLSEILSKFDVFQKNVPRDQLPEVLRLAAMNIKYMKVSAGNFLYHKGEASQCIYFVIKGEAWKFRPKTESEIEREAKVGHHKQTAKPAPKILETIRLAKALKERDLLLGNQMSLESINESTKPTTLSSINAMTNSLITMPSLPNGSRVATKISDIPSIESLNSSRSQDGQEGEGKGQTEENHPKINFNTMIRKIMNKKDMLNFENDYFFNIVKRNEDLASKYVKDNMNMMRFDRKILPGECVGELSMGLDYARTSSVMAYTNLYVIYLDQKSYEKVFTNQIDEVREKVQFFVNYFKDIKYNVLRRMCLFFQEQKFKIGDIIYKEGSSCDDLYFIKSGEVQLLKAVETEESLLVGYEKMGGSLIALTPEPRKTTKNVIVTSIVDGYFFGEEPLFDTHTRDFTAKSVSNLVCYKITSQILAKLPQDMIKMLHDFAISKQAWRGNRLKDITRSSSIFTRSSTNLNTPIKKRNTSKEPEQSKLKSIERQNFGRLLIADKSVDSFASPKRQKESSIESVGRSATEFDDQLCRFKLNTKVHQEDKSPYVLKYFSEENKPNKRETLSLWTRNMSRGKERKRMSWGTRNPRSISSSKDDQYDQGAHPKLSARNLKRDCETESSTLPQKSNTESRLTAPKTSNGCSRRDRVVQNLSTKFSRESIDKVIKTVPDQHPYCLDVAYAKYNKHEGMAREVVRSKLKQKEKSMQALNDVKPQAPKSLKSPILREPVTAYHFSLNSLTNLDISTQWPSFKDLTSPSNMEPKSKLASPTLLKPSPFIKLFGVKKNQN